MLRRSYYMRDCMDWRKLVDGRIVVKRLQRSGILFNPWGPLLSLDDSGALYDYLGIKQIDSSLAGKEKWMLENDSTSSPRSYVSSDEFQITQIWWRWYSLLIHYINRKETFKMIILWCPKKTSRAGRLLKWYFIGGQAFTTSRTFQPEEYLSKSE